MVSGLTNASRAEEVRGTQDWYLQSEAHEILLVHVAPRSQGAPLTLQERGQLIPGTGSPVLSPSPDSQPQPFKFQVVLHLGAL